MEAKKTGRHKEATCTCVKCVKRRADNLKKMNRKTGKKKPEVKAENTGGEPLPEKTKEPEIKIEAAPEIKAQEPETIIETIIEPVTEPEIKIENLETKTIEPEIKIEAVTEPEIKAQEPETIIETIIEPVKEPEAKAAPLIADDSAKFDEFVETNTPAPEPEKKAETEIGAYDKDGYDKDGYDKDGKDRDGYKKVKLAEQAAADETASPEAKKSFQQIADKKSQTFNALMLIAACDWLFPKIIKFYYLNFKKDKRINDVKFSEIKLTPDQIQSLGDSAEAMAEFIFQYINPAWFFFIGLFMHYDTNTQKALDKLPPIDKKDIDRDAMIKELSKKITELETQLKPAA